MTSFGGKGEVARAVQAVLRNRMLNPRNKHCPSDVLPLVVASKSVEVEDAAKKEASSAHNSRKEEGEGSRKEQRTTRSFRVDRFACGRQRRRR